MKQFVNLFRLRWYIAHETGLLDGGSGLTPEKIGTFVAFQVGYPLLVFDLVKSPELIDDLKVKNNTKPLARRWLAQDSVVRLLKLSEDWELTQADVRKLIRVSLRVRTIDDGLPEPQDSAPRSAVATESQFQEYSESLSDSDAAVQSEESHGPSVWIHSARWGTGPADSGYTDVTEILRGYLNRGAPIRASNEFFSDPYPGKPKHLIVVYSRSRRAERQLLTFQENAPIEWPGVFSAP